MTRCTSTGGDEMRISLENSPAAKTETQALVTYVFEAEKDSKQLDGAVAEVDLALDGAIGRLVTSGELTGKPLEMTLLHMLPGVTAERVLIVGAGKRDKFSNADLRKLAAAAVRHLRGKSVKR